MIELTIEAKDISRLEEQLKAHWIIQVAVRYFGITYQQAKIKTRHQDIMIPRRVAVYLIAKYTKLTLQEIADLFDQDHATVIQTKNEVENMCLTNYKGIRDHIDSIDVKLNLKY